MDLLTHSAFEISVCQATIFTPDEDLSSAKVIRVLYPQWSEVFDDDPEVRPSLPGFPAEVPRVILQNKSGSLRFEIAAARANLFLRKTGKDQLAIAVDEFYEEATRLFSACQQLIGCRVGRLAAVVTRFAKHSTPGLFLARHFCKESWNEMPLDRPGNFELHVHKRFVLADQFEVNSWARSKTGYLTIEDETTPIVLFEQDINTLAEESNSREFNCEEIQRFFDKVIPELDSILRLYYPIQKGA